MTTVSIVIPTRDRSQRLLATVRSILAGERQPDEIVIGDQSTGRSASPAGDDSVEIVHLRLSSTGSSTARNAAIGAARGDLLVFLDDDVRVSHDWLDRIVGTLAAASPRTVVTGAVLSDEVGDGHVPSLKALSAPATFSGRLFADPLFAGNMALRRGAFDEVGLFDERLGAGARFPAAGDNDLGFRLLEAGYVISYVPDAVVYHGGVRRGSELARLDWSYGRGQGAFYAKHMSRSDRHMLRRLGRNAAYRLRRTPPALRGDRQAAREAIYLAGLICGAVDWRLRYGRPAPAPRASQRIR